MRNGHWICGDITQQGGGRREEKEELRYGFVKFQKSEEQQSRECLVHSGGKDSWLETQVSEPSVASSHQKQGKGSNDLEGRLEKSPRKIEAGVGGQAIKGEI